MIIWINGPFGGGKSTTADLLHHALPGSILFDPEDVGSLLRGCVPADHPKRHKDFQDYPMWRPLVAETAVHLDRYVDPHPVIAPMTLLHPHYAKEIFDAIHAAGVELRHLLLHADPGVLTARIDSSIEFPDDENRSEKVRAFRRLKTAAYREAYQTWLPNNAEVIDTTILTPREVADQALKLIRLP
ncbi:AAA family ATPase (plasmid) [Streptosporangium sp. NBC_01495]|uniref:AAA family ATPase n=1 Tax=Streptosporangium sp. NBC_01495 TaxID=2903899 RepID=UPI002E310465|nr:AAA family ATPase [Streptosporangium sp. NBC_01495]